MQLSPLAAAVNATDALLYRINYLYTYPCSILVISMIDITVNIQWWKSEGIIESLIYSFIYVSLIGLIA